MDNEVKASELDGDGFDAEAYVRRILAGQGLEGVLRVEGGLINGLLLSSSWLGEWDGNMGRVRGLLTRKWGGRD